MKCKKMINVISSNNNKNSLNNRTAISLLEILIAFAIFSIVLLPITIFFIEYFRTAGDVSFLHQVTSLLEEKMEVALSLPYKNLPVGETKDCVVLSESSISANKYLDLRPIQLASNLVTFRMIVEEIPLEASAIKNLETGELARFRFENCYKKVTIIASWDKNKGLDLTGYKGDL